MEQDVIERLLEFLENVAPELWSSAMSKAYVEALFTGAIAVILFVASIVLFVFARYVYKRIMDSGGYGRETDAQCNAGLLGMAGLLTIVIGSILVYNVMMYIAAPELKAIGILLGLVK